MKTFGPARAMSRIGAPAYLVLGAGRLLCGSVLLWASAAASQERAPGSALIGLTTPAAGSTVVAKKPDVDVAIRVDYEPDSLQVILDDVDVTELVDLEEGGLKYEPPHVLPGGPHVLTVRLRTRDGAELTRELGFSTRHTQNFVELSSAAQLGLEAERLAERKASPGLPPDYRGEGELAYSLHAAEGRWDTRVENDLWFLSQRMPVFEPPREGLDLASFSVTTARRGERHELSAAVGDVRVTGTDYSLSSLSRRGATFGFDYGPAFMGAFAVSARQLFGFNGGLGAGTDPSSNIYGITTGLDLLDDKLRVDAIHARGGEPSGSFGMFAAHGGTRGDVTGISLTARPSTALEVQLEHDTSRFDADTSDGRAARRDKAQALRLAGRKSVFNYQLAYERIGPEYAVVATPVPNDRRNVAASGGFTLTRHSLSMTALHQHDNLAGDPARVRLGNREASLEYGYVASERWAFGVGYRDSQISSSDEPVGMDSYDVRTTNVTGRLQYTRQPWAIGFDVGRSNQDDAYFDAADSEVTSVSLSPSYQTPHFNISALMSVASTATAGTRPELEQRSVSLMLNGHAADERIGYGLVFSHYGEESLNSRDADTRSTELRVSYRFRRRESEQPLGALSLRATRLRTIDRIGGTELEDWAVWLTVSITPRFAF